MAKVTLDVETFKALASPTRLDVLRALDERRKTLSELAKELELNKATIHEHLALLVACRLVKKRDDEGRKWIYYELTWQGERLMHPQDTTTFAVLLGISVAAAGGGLMFLGRALDWWWQEKQLDMSQPIEPIPESGERQGIAAADEGSDGSGSEPPSGGSGGAGSASGSTQTTTNTQTASQSEMAEEDGRFLYDNSTADEASTQGEALIDEDGLISILFILTSMLLAGLAFVVRRRR